MGGTVCNPHSTTSGLNTIWGLWLKVRRLEAIMQDLVGHTKGASRECGLCSLGKRNYEGQSQLHSRKMVLSTEDELEEERLTARNLLGGCCKVQDINYYFNLRNVDMPNPCLWTFPDHRL